jgi:hypothetical protein
MSEPLEAVNAVPATGDADIPAATSLRLPDDLFTASQLPLCLYCHKPISLKRVISARRVKVEPRWCRDSCRVLASQARKAQRDASVT